VTASFGETCLYALVALPVIFDPAGTAALFAVITPHDPGAITTMVLLHSRGGANAAGLAAIELALVAALGVTLAGLLMARHVARLLGDSGASVIGRVLGVLLAALAAQFARDGLRESRGFAAA
jgi:small neutral amino acid transporter SnatA (MarC family)